ncbi:hypothetical protein F5Y04DRAFT_280689 [Hypomontagnella monticulosa]|nr:hypothetical protein F5Y04DRAFT_280689 [Hypomontagnella monticulosa]
MVTTANLVQVLLGTTIPIVWAGAAELPHIQRNPAFPAMTAIPVARGFQEMTDLAAFNSYNPIPLKRRKDGKLVRRQCTVPTTTSDSTSESSVTESSTTDQPASITAAPSISCELHNEDPDQGINTAFCLCNSTITLSVLPATKAQSESCAYSTMPGSSAIATVTTQTEIMTVNCLACTIIGGIADDETCTTVSGCTPTAAPTPTIAAWVGNLSTIDIGNAEDGNNGKDLATEMFNKLKGMCDGSGGCKADPAIMDNVEGIIAEGEEPLKPAMYLQDATYSSQKILEQMLSIGISSWVSALNNEQLGLCKEVEYEYDADPTGSGCGHGPIPGSLRRKVRRDNNAVIWERSGLALEESRLKERCFDNCDPPMVCHTKARMCNAPNEITVVMAGQGDPYANRLNIGVTLESTEDGFPCEEITAALTAAVAILAPELLEADVLEGVELEAICGIIDDPMSIINGLQDTVRVAGRSEPK